MRLHVTGMARVEYVMLHCGFGGYQKDSALYNFSPTFAYWNTHYRCC